MNLSDEKINGNNTISLTDSLNAPLLELKVSNNASTVIPSTSDLIIYIDKASTLTDERKQYIFPLNSALNIIMILVMNL
jgi:hypothetical protein